MSPKPGIYFLRAVTVGHPPGVGGEYATVAGIGRRIETAAQRPNLVNNQYWRLEQAKGDDVWYIFKSPPPNSQDAGLGEPGFHNSSVHPRAPVTLSNTASTYRISNRGNNVYVINPTETSGEVRVDYVIGVSDEKKLEIQPIMFISRDPPLPGWELKLVQ